MASTLGIMAISGKAYAEISSQLIVIASDANAMGSAPHAQYVGSCLFPKRSINSLSILLNTALQIVGFSCHPTDAPLTFVGACMVIPCLDRASARMLSAPGRCTASRVDLVVLAPLEKLYGLGAQGPAAGAPCLFVYDTTDRLSHWTVTT